MSVALSGKLREQTGKKATAKARKENYLPAVLYGLKDNFPLLVNPKVLSKIMKEKGHNTLIDLSIEGDSRKERNDEKLREQENELMVEPLRHSRLVSILEGYCDEAVLAVAGLSPSPLVGQRLQHYLKELQTVRPVLGGEDLLAMGVPEGPDVGRLLAKLREAKLDGSVSGEADERRLVQRFVNQPGSPSAHA